MTWFKSLIMRQNSPLLLINNLNSNEEDYDDCSTSNINFISTRRISALELISRQIQVRQSNKLEQDQVATTQTTNLFSEHPTNKTSSRLRRRRASSETFREFSKTKTRDCQEIVKSFRISKQVRRASQITKTKSPPPTSSSSSSFLLIKGQTRMSSIYHVMALLTLLCGLAYVSIQAQGAAQDVQYFEVQPEALNLAQSGQDVRLRCLVRNRLGDCLWMRNNRILGPIPKKYQFNRAPEDGDCSILIKNVSVAQDDGTWQCQVIASDSENDLGIQSREVQLTVLVAPERPQIKNVAQSNSFLLTASNGNQAAPNNNNNNLLLQRVTQSKLRLSDIKRSMNGKNLTCVGVHQIINQSNSVELDVQYVPTVSVVQREYSIVEGSPLSVNCQVDANPPPNIVNWRLVGDGNNKATFGNQQLALPNKPGPVLEFERITRDLNQNVFECLAQNSYGVSAPTDIKLNVLFAPYLINTSSSNSVLVGQQATLDCIFDGNPSPEIQWNYIDPLARTQMSHHLDNNKRQSLIINNVTYRNEGEYHCEAKNSINGVNYAVRSGNIALDVYGEPQFLVKSPSHAKAIQGTKSDLSLTFCSDPIPNKVYWHFGSLRLDVRLNNINGNVNGAQGPNLNPVALPGGPKQTNALNARYQAHPLQSLQKRESAFSKQPTCFEAQLTILDPEMIDQRDYTLMVQNERGHQAAVVRLRVSSPLSPVLMITSAFLTICSLFIFSFLVIFLIKKRNNYTRSASQRANGVAGNGQANGYSSGHANGGTNGTIKGAKNKSSNGINGMVNGEKNVEHLANGNGNTAAAATAQQLMQQQTRNGIVNGSGNGAANNASNIPSNGLHSDHHVHGHMMMSMASSDTSNDQKQLLASSDRNSSSASTSSTANSDTNSTATPNQIDSTSHGINHSPSYNNMSPSEIQVVASNRRQMNLNSLSSLDGRSSVNGSGGGHCEEVVSLESISSPTMNHLSVEEVGDEQEDRRRQDQHDEDDDDDDIGVDQQSLASRGIPTHFHTSALRNSINNSGSSSTINNNNNNNRSNGLIYANIDYKQQEDNEQQNNGSLSPNGKVSMMQQHRVGQPEALKSSGQRPSVGATIAMMNNLAASSHSNNQPMNAGVLSGAINQQFSINRQLRKPGPPKPPKPSIQQRSRFYQQQAAAAAAAAGAVSGNQANISNNGLVMIGSLANEQHMGGKEPSASELAVEYSRIAFPARAEL